MIGMDKFTGNSPPPRMKRIAYLVQAPSATDAKLLEYPFDEFQADQADYYILTYREKVSFK